MDSSDLGSPLRNFGQLFLDVAIEDIDALSIDGRQALENELRDYIASLFVQDLDSSPSVHAEDVVIESIHAGSAVVEFSVLEITLDQLQTGLYRSITSMYNVNFIVCSDGCILGYAIVESGILKPPVYRNEQDTPATLSGGSNTTALSSGSPPAVPPTFGTGLSAHNISTTQDAQSNGFERFLNGYHGFMKNVVVHHLAPHEEHLFEEWVWFMCCYIPHLFRILGVCCHAVIAACLRQCCVWSCIVLWSYTRRIGTDLTARVVICVAESQRAVYPVGPRAHRDSVRVLQGQSGAAQTQMLGQDLQVLQVPPLRVLEPK